MAIASNGDIACRAIDACFQRRGTTARMSKRLRKRRSTEKQHKPRRTAMPSLQSPTAPAATDSFSDLASAPVVAYIKHLAGNLTSIWGLNNGIIGQQTVRRPREVRIGACSIDGDDATLEVAGRIDESSVCGRVVLRRYAGSWHVLSEDYSGCASQRHCLDAPRTDH
jgi:hypothetical protein